MEETLFQICIGLITTIFGFLIGRADNKLNLQREVQKERVENLYMPFVKLYDITHMAAAYNFTDFSEEIQKQYIELLVNNMIYANKFTRDYIIQFMMIYNAYSIQEKKEGKKENKKYLNMTFNSICFLIREEYDNLSKKMYHILGDGLRNYKVKKEFKKIAQTDALEKVFMNNL